MTRQARILTALLALAAAALPLGITAQQTDSPVPALQRDVSATGDAPTYAQPNDRSGVETIRGRIISFDGGYDLQLHDDRGFIDAVMLRRGTIINPTGIQLAPGMRVTIDGVNSGSTFSANQIDTPYFNNGVIPGYPYAYPYPYPGYLYPGFGYPFSVGIGFGFRRRFR